MSVTASSGYPQYADTAIGFIPQLYAPSMLVKYYAKTVMREICNTKYEGLIKDKGDKVIIRQRPTITIRDYEKGQDLESEAPTSAPVTLNIDKAKYYDFVIDDVDEKQVDIVLSPEFTDDASEQMRIAIDTQVFGGVYADAHASNAGATAGYGGESFNLGATGAALAITSQNVIQTIEQVETCLDDLNVPEDGRYGVVPPWFRYLCMNSDLKNASIMGETPSITRTGRVGMVDRTMLYMNNLLTRVTDTYQCTHMIFGHKDAISFAAQLVKNENLRAPKKFGWEYRGLQVYGYKVVKAEGLVHVYGRKG